MFTIHMVCLCSLQNHAWYKQKFESYPPHRKAIIPFIL
ncbi:hypothetical protein EON63_06995 [archaeon]|nr:MAG: hypothetical protein EON63_06995 [archaeon]